MLFPDVPPLFIIALSLVCGIGTIIFWISLIRTDASKANLGLKAFFEQHPGEAWINVVACGLGVGALIFGAGYWVTAFVASRQTTGIALTSIGIFVEGLAISGVAYGNVRLGRVKAKLRLILWGIIVLVAVVLRVVFTR